MGCHFLLQGISWTQRSNPCLLSPASAGGLLTTGPPGKSAKSHSESPDSQYRKAWAARSCRQTPATGVSPTSSLCLYICHREGQGRPFSFIFVNCLVLPKISYLPIDPLLAECYVLPSNKHAPFRYPFPSVFQTFLYQSASIIMGLREVQR